MRYFTTAAVALVLVAACSNRPEIIEADAPGDESWEQSKLIGPFASPAEFVVSGARMADLAYVMPPAPIQNTEQYEGVEPNPIKLTSQEPVSTFSSDVDTTAYSVMRRYIRQNNTLPPSDSVRVEELVNYFDYKYPKPESAKKPFTPTIWVTPSPWRDGAKLMHIGVKGFDLQPKETPPSNVVLLLDVSGSMDAQNKLPLVKKSVSLMLDEMDADDTISIVVYAGAAGVVLEPTPASQKAKIRRALNNLSAGGSTAGGEGIDLAYSLAEENFAEDKINRIILATDGDFNVGVVDADSLEDYVARKRKTGIYLTVLGFGQGNYNDVIAQKLAQSGNGVAAYIDNLDEARKVLVREFRSTVFPIAHDLKFQVEFNPAVVAEYRLIGYETRILNTEDFNNDAIDAGDIGSGHTVTALYEMVPVDSNARLIDDLRYQKAEAPDGPTNEYAFVKLRYKLPKADASELITVPVRVADQYTSLTDAPADARFAAAVAAYGQKLQRAGHTESFAYSEIIKLAQSAKGDDAYGQRAQFVQLVRSAADIDKVPENG